jgi:outer membrane lipoprotein SlyB
LEIEGANYHEAKNSFGGTTVYQRSKCMRSKWQVNKEGVGTIVGAGLGALVGSRFGGGKGKLATVAIGALGDAFLGSRLGQQLDKSDRAQAAKAQRKAHIVPVGRTPKQAIIAGDTRHLSILVAIQKKPMV